MKKIKNIRRKTFIGYMSGIDIENFDDCEDISIRTFKNCNCDYKVKVEIKIIELPKFCDKIG